MQIILGSKVGNQAVRMIGLPPLKVGEVPKHTYQYKHLFTQ
jgi:hypothetical protein